MHPCREAKTSKRVAGCAGRAQPATTWQRRALLARVVALVALLVVTSTASADVLIRGARLIDATGAPPREAVDVLLIRKRVAAIGDELAAGGIPVLDASGLTLPPGLIDSHVHLAAAPGSALRGDTSADIHALNRVHLRAFLASETALGPFRMLPTSGPELARAISNAAEERELPLYVHAMNEPDADRALELGAHAIVHAPMGGAWRGDFFEVDDLSDRYVERLRASGASQRADLVLVEGDPLADLGALGRVRFAVRDGVVRTPEQWMSAGRVP